MDSIQKLTELFRQFPGIGPRQAKRFVYFLLGQKNDYSTELAKLVSELKRDIVQCDFCFRFFPRDKSESLTCPICRDTSRNGSQLMIVSRDVDFENIEKTKSFTGYYFVLGGTVPILETEPQDRIRQKELVDVVTKRSKGGLKAKTSLSPNNDVRSTQSETGLREIILALDYNPEGENTRDHLTRLLGPLGIKFGFNLSSLGRGLSTGSELEYSDPDTIKNALESRK